MELTKLDFNKTYTYADYLKWDFPERVELINGKLYQMMPAPSSMHQEISNKIDLYEQAGVKEYWIVSPQDNTFLVNILVDGKYITSRPMTSPKSYSSTVLKGFTLDLKELFKTD